jgi:Protein of unknown function (DUF402)
VQDRPERRLLYAPPGMVFKCPVKADGTWQRVPDEPWALGDRTWTEHHCLSFSWQGVAHTPILFWNEDWEFAGWYVNLERPLRPTPIGWDYMDDMLDIDVEPDRTWRWKDEDELAYCVERGLYTSARAVEIRAEGERAIARLERREEPFGDEWIGWRPDPAWPVPALAPGWESVPFSR